MVILVIVEPIKQLKILNINLFPFFFLVSTFQQFVKIQEGIIFVSFFIFLFRNHVKQQFNAGCILLFRLLRQERPKNLVMQFSFDFVPLLAYYILLLITDFAVSLRQENCLNKFSVGQSNFSYIQILEYLTGFVLICINFIPD